MSTAFEVNRVDLARALAERGVVTQEEAQDELDRVVHGVLRDLRRAGVAEMPGIGKLTATRPVHGQAPGGLRSRRPRSSKR